MLSQLLSRERLNRRDVCESWEVGSCVMMSVWFHMTWIHTLNINILFVEQSVCQLSHSLSCAQCVLWSATQTGCVAVVLYNTTRLSHMNIIYLDKSTCQQGYTLHAMCHVLWIDFALTIYRTGDCRWRWGGAKSYILYGYNTWYSLGGWQVWDVCISWIDYCICYLIC